MNENRKAIIIRQWSKHISLLALAAGVLSISGCLSVHVHHETERPAPVVVVPADQPPPPPPPPQ